MGEVRAPRLVIPLETARPSERASMGAKAAHLADLIAAGLPVPPAVVIGREAQPLAGALDPEVELAIRAAYRGLGGGRVAVRASPEAAEPGRSYAGQFDAFVGVHGEDEVVAAVRQCWASVDSERAAAYRRAQSEARAPLAVIIQRMIPADVAGVLYTIDPVGGTDLAVIEAAWGLGAGVVSGRVATDTFLVDRAGGELRGRHLRPKPTQLVPSAEGVAREVEVPAARRDAPTLGDRDVKRLAELGRTIRRFYGREQDIEWAMAGSDLYILQCRPIARHRSPKPSSRPIIGSGTIWSRRNIGEMLDGILTPLSQSFALFYQDEVHARCLAGMGLAETGDASQYYAIFGGRLYANVAYFAHLLSQSPLWRDLGTFTAAFTDPQLDLGSFRNPYGRLEGWGAVTRAFVHWGRHEVIALAAARRRVEAQVATSEVERRDFERKNLPARSQGQLGAELERQLTSFADAYATYMQIVFDAITAHGLVAKLLLRWLGPEGQRYVTALGAQLDLGASEAGAMLELVERASEVPRVVEILLDAAPSLVDTALAAEAEGQAFRSAVLNPFLSQHGDRCRQEMELTIPRWREDPAPVYARIQQVLASPEVRSELAGRRAEIETPIPSGPGQGLSRLGFSRRPIVGAAIASFEQLAALRHDARRPVVASISRIRALVLEAGRRLVCQGVLTSLEEVAYLDLPGLRAWLGGRAAISATFGRAVIDERHRAHLQILRGPIPPVSVIGGWAAPQHERSQSDDPSVLTGVGSSPGLVTAHARVITDLDRQLREFRPGEVLVAPSPEVSWIDLYASASAVVTDTGSMLSHASTLSREFNLPAVVAVGDATQRIKTGDLVTVDADAGTVRIEARAEASEV